MICKTCAEAGSYNQLANAVDPDDDRTHTLRRIARSIHSKCPDINCTCAHQTGFALVPAARKFQALLLARGAELDAPARPGLFGNEPRNLFRRDGATDDG